MPCAAAHGASSTRTNNQPADVYTHPVNSGTHYIPAVAGCPQELKTEVILRADGRDFSHVSPGTCKSSAIRAALAAHPGATVLQVRVYVPNAGHPAPGFHKS